MSSSIDIPNQRGWRRVGIGPKMVGNAVKAATKKKSRPSADACRNDTERLVWMGLYSFVNAHPELFSKACGLCSLTNAQATLLRTMNPEAPAAMSSLATALGCHASNVTGLVDRLEEQGLVTRQASAEDRRVKQIALTTKGNELREQLHETMFEAPSELARLDDDELRTLHQLVQRLEG